MMDKTKAETIKQRYNDGFIRVDIESYDHDVSEVILAGDDGWAGNNQSIIVKEDMEFIQAANTSNPFTANYTVDIEEDGEYRILIYGLTHPTSKGTIALKVDNKAQEKPKPIKSVDSFFRCFDFGTRRLTEGNRIFNITGTGSAAVGILSVKKVRRFFGDSDGQGDLKVKNCNFTENGITAEDIFKLQLLHKQKFIDPNKTNYHKSGLVFEKYDVINISMGENKRKLNHSFGGYIIVPTISDNQLSLTLDGKSRLHDMDRVQIMKELVIKGAVTEFQGLTYQASNLYDALNYAIENTELPLTANNLKQVVANEIPVKNGLVIDAGSKRFYNKFVASKMNKALVKNGAKGQVLQLQNDYKKNTNQSIKIYDSANKLINNGKPFNFKNFGTFFVDYGMGGKKQSTITLKEIKTVKTKKTATKFKLPGTVNVNAYSAGGQAFSNPNNVKVKGDNNNASVAVTSSTLSQYLVLTNFNFNIPTTSLVSGIEIRIKKKGEDVKDAEIYLRRGSLSKRGRIGTNKAKDGAWNKDKFKDAKYGGKSVKWGAKLTPAMVNANTFGLLVKVKGAKTTSTALIDSIEVKVHYTPTKKKAFYKKVKSETGFDVQRPFQCWIEIAYSTTPNGSLKYVNIDLTSSTTTNKIGAIPLNIQEKFWSRGEIDVVGVLTTTAPQSAYYLRQIHLKTKTPPQDLYQPRTTKFNTSLDYLTAYKMMFKQFGFKSGSPVIPEMLKVNGKSPKELFKLVCERLNYAAIVVPGKERRYDQLYIEKKGAVLSNFIIKEGDNLLDQTNLKYDPSETINKVMKVFKNTNGTYNAVCKVDARNIGHFGTDSNYEVLNEEPGLYQAKFLAMKDLDDSSLPDWSYSAEVLGLPDAHVGRLVPCYFYNNYYDDIKTIESVEVFYTENDRKVWMIVGLDEPDISLNKIKQDYQKLKKKLIPKAEFTGGVEFIET